MTNVDILAKTWGQKTAGSGTFYAKFIHHLKLCYVSFTVWSFHTKKKLKIEVIFNCFNLQQRLFIFLF